MACVVLVADARLCLTHSPKMFAKALPFVHEQILSGPEADASPSSALRVTGRLAGSGVLCVVLATACGSSVDSHQEVSGGAGATGTGGRTPPSFAHPPSPTLARRAPDHEGACERQRS